MIASFVLKLLAGITTTWLLMPRRDVADGFFRIQMLVVLGLAVLLVLAFDPVALAGPPQIPDGVPATSPQAASAIASQQELSGLPTAVRWLRGCAFAIAVLAYPGHILWKLGRRPAGTFCILAIGLLSLASLALLSVQLARGTPIVLQLLADGSSAMVLGGVLTGMLLGHWYLTSPGMSLKPLLWFCPVLAGAATARLAATGLAIATSGLPPSDLVRMIWLALRILGGILAPAAAALLVRQILRYRNTQSATGVLFAVLILVFMGEMSAALLERDLGVPY
jgi:hypothetical protein